MCTKTYFIWIIALYGYLSASSAISRSHPQTTDVPSLERVGHTSRQIRQAPYHEPSAHSGENAALSRRHTSKINIANSMISAGDIGMRYIMRESLGDNFDRTAELASLKAWLMAIPPASLNNFGYLVQPSSLARLTFEYTYTVNHPDNGEADFRVALDVYPRPDAPRSPESQDFDEASLFKLGTLIKDFFTLERGITNDRGTSSRDQENPFKSGSLERKNRLWGRMLPPWTVRVNPNEVKWFYGPDGIRIVLLEHADAQWHKTPASTVIPSVVMNMIAQVLPPDPQLKCDYRPVFTTEDESWEGTGQWRVALTIGYTNGKKLPRTTWATVVGTLKPFFEWFYSPDRSGTPLYAVDSSGVMMQFPYRNVPAFMSETVNVASVLMRVTHAALWDPRWKSTAHPSERQTYQWMFTFGLVDFEEVDRLVALQMGARGSSSVPVGAGSMVARPVNPWTDDTGAGSSWPNNLGAADV